MPIPISNSKELNDATIRFLSSKKKENQKSLETVEKSELQKLLLFTTAPHTLLH